MGDGTNFRTNQSVIPQYTGMVRRTFQMIEDVVIVTQPLDEGFKNIIGLYFFFVLSWCYIKRGMSVNHCFILFGENIPVGYQRRSADLLTRGEKVR